MSWARDISAARSGGTWTKTHLTESDVVVGGKPVRYIAAHPLDLLAEAQAHDPELTDDEYALARMLASEGYSGDAAAWPAALVAMGETARNRAQHRGLPVARMLRQSKYGSPLAGRYGEQVGRFASTRRDPGAAEVMAARLALSGELKLAPAGSLAFFDPAAQAAGVQAGRKIRGPEAIIKRWAENDHLVYAGPVAGVDSYRMMLFRAEPRAIQRAIAVREALAVVGSRGGGGSLGPLLALAALVLIS